MLYQRCNSTATVPYAACTNILRWTDAADATEGAAVRWSVEIFPYSPTIYASVMGPGAGLQLRGGFGDLAAVEAVAAGRARASRGAVGEGGGVARARA